MAFGLKGRISSRSIAAASAAMVLVGSFATASPALAGKTKPKPQPGNSTPEKLARAVTLPGLLSHAGTPLAFLGVTSDAAFGSLRIDDPAFAQPIRAALFQNTADKSAWSLRWNRQPKSREQD